MDKEIWQKIFAGIIGLGIGYVVPVLTYEQRIADLERFEEQTRHDRFRREDANLLVKDLELELERIRSDIRSNRTFIRRECFRNNHQDEDSGQRPLNNCDQEY